jgi:hypothetical protein
MDKINEILDSSNMNTINEDDTSKSLMTTKQVSDDLIQKIMEDGNLTIYCVL